MIEHQFDPPHGNTRPPMICRGSLHLNTTARIVRQDDTLYHNILIILINKRLTPFQLNDETHQNYYESDFTNEYQIKGY